MPADAPRIEPIWGIDPSSKAVAIASATAGRFDTTYVEFAYEDSLGHQLNGIIAQTRALTIWLSQEHSPALVLVEQPANNNPKLHWATSAIVAGVHRGLVAACGIPAHIVPINIGTWKKSVLGKGNADKQEIVTALSHLTQKTIPNQDMADAMGIALHGLLTAR